MDNSRKYFNIKEILSTHRILNFVVGQRGIGKTVSAKDEGADRFLKDGSKFFYMRRYKADIDFIIEQENFWGIVGDMYRERGHELTQKKDKLYIDGEHCGTMISFSQYQRLKSGEYNNYGFFMFDEFIADDNKYKKDEVNLFANIIHSIARVRSSKDIQFVLIANSVRLMNPYFEEFGIIPNPIKDITLYKGIAIQMCKNYHEFSQEMLENSDVGSVVGRLKSYREMAFDNKFSDDNDINIKLKPKKAQHIFYFKKDGKYYGFWLYKNEIYVSKKYQPNSKYSFAFTEDDLFFSDLNQGDEKLRVKSFAMLELLDIVIEAKELNNIYFEDIFVREEAIKILKKMGVY